MCVVVHVLVGVRKERAPAFRDDDDDEEEASHEDENEDENAG